jgi:Tfp pilus assembly protein PilV
MQRRRGGFSIVEVTLATLVLGIAMVAALNLVASSAQGRELAVQRTVAEGLAQRMLGEVMDRPFARWDASDPLASDLSREAGETVAAWARFNDVGDFNGLRQAPPTDGAGTMIAGAESYTWAVQVMYTSTEAPGKDAGKATGVKRIEVTVSRG